MTALVYANIAPMAAALLIGIVTGYWAFRRRPRTATAKPTVNIEDEA